jgi:hypothetical protein
MKIDIITSNATQLDNKIFSAAGKTLETWEVREIQSTGKRFLTPVAQQYNNVVILQLMVNSKTNNLEVTPHYWTGSPEPTIAVNAIVLGMFTAALLTHFSGDFTKLETIK